ARRARARGARGGEGARSARWGGRAVRERAMREGTRSAPLPASGHAKRAPSRARRPRSEKPGSAGQLVLALGDRRLAVGRLVAVDDALANGLVQLARSVAHQRTRGLGVAGLDRGVVLADRRLERRLDRLVAQAGLLVLL